MPSLAEAGVALGLAETWDLSPMRDDGTMVPPDSGPGGLAAGLVPFVGTINPAAPIVGTFTIKEVDPVAAKAYADSCNARWGRGFAQPWEPDPNAPPASPGVPRQRLISMDARGWGNLDERAPAIQEGGVFHHGDWGGALDAQLPDGYRWTATDIADHLRLKKLADLMGRAGAHVSPIPAPITQPQPPSQQSTAGPSVAPPVSPTPIMPSGEQMAPHGVPGTVPTRTARLLGRFRVSGSYSSKARNLGGEISFAAATDGFGIVTFLNDAQLVVKAVNGVALNGRFWIFVASLTDVSVTLKIEDMLKGTSKVYTSVDGRIEWSYETAGGGHATVAVVMDTDAFAA